MNDRKRCTKCGEVKPLEDFVNKPSSKDGRTAHCTLCNRKRVRKYYRPEIDVLRRQKHYRADPDAKKAYDVKRLYGVTFPTASRLWNSPCAVCEKPASENQHGKSHIDHCHQTGRVRGALCFPCNSALGKFRDSPSLLRAAIEYLAADTDYRDAPEVTA